MSAPKVDAKEFRQRYLATLRKQVSVNEKNLQANTLFKQTAQPTPLEDTRTITEKTADDQQLQALLRRELAKLTDSGSASAIVSALDVAGRKQLVENFGAIESELRRRFKFGFTKETFLPFFQKFMESLEETGGFAPTATQIAEKVAPSVAEAVSTAGFKQDTSMDANVIAIIRDMDIDEIDDRFPKGSRKWVPLRNYFLELLRYELGAGGGYNEYAKAFYNDIIKKKLKTASAKQYAEWFRGLDAEEKDTLIDGVFGFQAPPTASAVEEEEYILPSLRPKPVPTRVGFGKPSEGKGMCGKGLSKSSSKGKETPTKNVVLSVSGGIPAEARFANFGRYLIDKGALKDNLAVIRFSSGACIHQIPKQKISANMSRVLKGIAGGALPSYDDMDSLNTDERKWLYDVSHRARLGINVPNPKKDEETREMEDFEKMKGQIIAGNDNKDLVKKFKITLLKLAKEGRVPKREANEVLMELALVGL